MERGVASRQRVCGQWTKGVWSVDKGGGQWIKGVVSGLKGCGQWLKGCGQWRGGVASGSSSTAVLAASSLRADTGGCHGNTLVTWQVSCRTMQMLPMAKGWLPDR